MSPDSYNQIEIHKHKNNGYTLVEIMLSITMLGVIALSLCNTFAGSMVLSNRDNDVITANNLARQYLNEVKVNWSTVDGFNQTAIPTVSSVYTNNSKYTVTTSSSILEYDTESDPILKRVKVTYKDKKDHTLIDISNDFNRPVSYTAASS